MPRNVEIKARISSVDALARKVAAIADTGPEKIIQDDIFFQCKLGRLKLRVFSNDNGELIFYRRSNEKDPKESFYLRSHTSNPATMRESLALAYGEAGRVQKHRILFLVGRTRVHLDTVEGLGVFLELEVVLENGERLESGVEEALCLMENLGVQQSQLIEGAYVDLLAESTSV